MTDDKMQTELDGRLEQANTEPMGQQTQQSQPSAKPQSERRPAPGRIPLFRR
jgi:hypothetical protein